MFHFPGGHESLHFQCRMHHGGGRGGLRVRQAAHAHVRVTDGLDLFDAVPGDDVIERLETGIEFAEQLVGTQFRGHGREALEVGKEHRSLFEMPCLGGTRGLEFLGYFRRQDVQ